MSTKIMEADVPQRLEPAGRIGAAAIDGLCSAVVIGRSVRAARAVVAGGPVVRRIFPLPHGVDVFALSANGMSFVDPSGGVWIWEDAWVGKPGKSAFGRYTLAYTAGAES